MLEGYQKRLEDNMQAANKVAYITYASVTAAAGVEPKSYDDWEKPSTEVSEYDGPLKEGREIDAEYKAMMEAEMNKT